MFEILTFEQLKPRLDKIKFKEGHFHHTYLPSKKDYDGTDASAQRLQKNMLDYHVNTNHWSTIGQHVTLLPDGRFITGRDFNQTPASILGFNEGAFACETLGNFDKNNDSLIGPQKEAALKLADYFTDRGLYFRFHRENASKTCPGTSIDKVSFMAQAAGQICEVAKPVAPITAHEGSELVRQIQELINEASISTLKVDGLWGIKTEGATPILKKGMDAAKKVKLKWIIRFAQKRLIELGYKLPIYGPDGDFGTETYNAVLAFQKANHLVADGIIGKITWCRLLGV